MGIIRRPTLQQRSTSQLAGDRSAVAIVGTCRIGDRPQEDVLITELGADGCRLRAGTVGMTKTEPLVLRIGTVGPVTARLMWAKGGALGVLFEEPLADDLVEALCAASTPPDTVVALRRGPAS
jgi:hypothetical protein